MHEKASCRKLFNLYKKKKKILASFALLDLILNYML